MPCHDSKLGHEGSSRKRIGLVLGLVEAAMVECLVLTRGLADGRLVALWYLRSMGGIKEVLEVNVRMWNMNK